MTKLEFLAIAKKKLSDLQAAPPSAERTVKMQELLKEIEVAKSTPWATGTSPAIPPTSGNPAWMTAPSGAAVTDLSGFVSAAMNAGFQGFMNTASGSPAKTPGQPGGATTMQISAMEPSPQQEPFGAVQPAVSYSLTPLQGYGIKPTASTDDPNGLNSVLATARKAVRTSQTTAAVAKIAAGEDVSDSELGWGDLKDLNPSRPRSQDGKGPEKTPQNFGI